MSSLRPWHEIAVPHREVLQGTVQQSENATNLGFTTKSWE
jgi:hypothetical protein